MGNEIKVNEFIRTKYGEIAKVIEYKDEIVLDKEIKFYGMYRGYICEDEIDFIVKHSSNLIDLIQCGDYVNGKQVSNVDKIDNINFIEWTDGDMYKTEIENDKFIETIVTKEMMESISYKVTKM